MKKVVGLLLALAMTLGAAGALAAALPNGTITRADGTEAKPCMGNVEPHYGSSHDSGSDYCFYTNSMAGYSVLYVLNPGLTISSFAYDRPEFQGIQIIASGNPMTLTLDGVQITVTNNAVSYQAEAALTLNLKNNTSLNGGNRGIYVQDNNLSASLTVTGDGTITGGISGIHVQNHINNTGDVACTLGGNLMVSGGERAVIFAACKTQSLKIDGETHPGIMLLAGASLNDADQIGIYERLEDVYGIDKVKNAKYIATRTEYELAADLPQTGDDSSLALWGALLAIAGAGMMARRKREA